METTQYFQLGAYEELRFEVNKSNNGNPITITMQEGKAEVFGTEMVQGKGYLFRPGTNLAIFSFEGCSIKLQGKTKFAHVAKETPMMAYLNAHAALETMRRAAQAQGKRGPIVAMVGPMDVGKSTLTRLLINYAVRLGRKPVYVDVDVGQGNISVPGAMGAMVINQVSTIEDGFVQQDPLTYFFGHDSPGKNVRLHNQLVSKLAETVHQIMENSSEVKASGAFINTCGWVTAEGYQCIIHLAQAFEVDVVIVLEQQALYNRLVGDMPPFVKVLFLPKSGGVVTRSQKKRQKTRSQRVIEYFHGKPPNQISNPSTLQMKLSEAKIFKIGLPVEGIKSYEYKTKISPIVPKKEDLVGRLMAVSSATDANEEQLVERVILAFVWVKDVDVDNDLLSVLSTTPGQLPNNVLFLSDIKVTESR